MAVNLAEIGPGMIAKARAEMNAEYKKVPEKTWKENFKNNALVKSLKQGKELPVKALKTYWQNDQLRSNLHWAAGSALFQVGLNWGFGGLGYLAGGAVSVGVRGARVAYQETNREFDKKKRELDEKIKLVQESGGRAEEKDLEEQMRLDSLKGIWSKYKALDDKSKVRKAIGIGMGSALVGALVGAGLKESGTWDLIASRHDVIRSKTVAGHALAGGVVGGAIEKWKNKKISPKGIIAGAVVGVVVGEVVSEIVGLGKPAAGVPRISNPDSSLVKDPQTNPANSEYYRPVHDPQSARLFEPNMAIPDDIMNSHNVWVNALTPEGQTELASLLKAARADNAFTLPDPDLRSPAGPNYPSLKGQIEGWYGNYLFGNLKDQMKPYPVSEAYFSRIAEQYGLNKDEFSNFYKAMTDIKNEGKFDPYNSDHLKVFNAIKRGLGEEESNKMITATYLYIKAWTPAANFNHENPDYFNRKQGIYPPKDLKAWFTKLQKIH